MNKLNERESRIYRMTEHKIQEEKKKSDIDLRIKNSVVKTLSVMITYDSKVFS